MQCRSMWWSAICITFTDLSSVCCTLPALFETVAVWLALNTGAFHMHANLPFAVHLCTLMLTNFLLFSAMYCMEHVCDQTQLLPNLKRDHGCASVVTGRNISLLPVEAYSSIL
eukprot:scpid13200/ scgid20535/ 